MFRGSVTVDIITNWFLDPGVGSFQLCILVGNLVCKSYVVCHKMKERRIQFVLNLSPPSLKEIFVLSFVPNLD